MTSPASTLDVGEFAILAFQLLAFISIVSSCIFVAQSMKRKSSNDDCSDAPKYKKKKKTKKKKKKKKGKNEKLGDSANGTEMSGISIGKDSSLPTAVKEQKNVSDQSAHTSKSKPNKKPSSKKKKQQPNKKIPACDESMQVVNPSIDKKIEKQAADLKTIPSKDDGRVNNEQKSTAVEIVEEHLYTNRKVNPSIGKKTKQHTVDFKTNPSRDDDLKSSHERLSNEHKLASVEIAEELLHTDREGNTSVDKSIEKQTEDFKINSSQSRLNNEKIQPSVEIAEERLRKNRERHLQPKMTRDQKRELYIRKNPVTIEDIHPLSDDPGNTYPVENFESDIKAEISKKVSIWQGDITRLEIDAVVNAANHHLGGGAGVDGAIHRAAGPDLLKENKYLLKKCPTGEAKVAAGYRLPAYYVIHTTGPQDGSHELLEMCYKNCLSEVLNNNIRTVAFPGISTGIYGFPLDEATHIAAKTVREWLEANLEKVDRIIFCVFLDDAVEAAYRIIPQYFPKYRHGAERVKD